MAETARVTLVTLIAVFEIEDRLVKDLHALGVKGYTIGKVVGRGVHGARLAGLADAPNMRIEVLVPPVLAKRILARLEQRYADQAVIAFTHEVDAVPPDQFG